MSQFIPILSYLGRVFSTNSLPHLESKYQFLLRDWTTSVYVIFITYFCTNLSTSLKVIETIGMWHYPILKMNDSFYKIESVFRKKRRNYTFVPLWWWSPIVTCVTKGPLPLPVLLGCLPWTGWFLGREFELTSCW